MTSNGNIQNVVRVNDVDAARRARAIEDAASLLAAGEVVVLPTETVYGLFVSAASAIGLDRLSTLLRSVGAEPLPHHWAWHAASRAAAIAAIRPVSPTHRRLVSRLLPGPVKFRVSATADELDLIRARIGGIAPSLHDGSTLSFRVPDEPTASAVIARAAELGHPLVACGLAAAGLGTGREVTPATIRATESPADFAPAMVLDASVTKYGKPATAIGLASDGSASVLSFGAIEERHIARHMTRTVLFVCTGNTCRSPMAEALAADLLIQNRGNAGAVPTRVLSAGTSAHSGMAITAESLVALEGLGIDTGVAREHRARELTRELIAQAEVVYAMTAAHARAARAIDPTAHVELLDPSGKDILDPIGQGQEVYTATARRMRDLIARRLAELDD